MCVSLLLCGGVTVKSSWLWLVPHITSHTCVSHAVVSRVLVPVHSLWCRSLLLQVCCAAPPQVLPPRLQRPVQQDTQADSLVGSAGLQPGYDL